MMDPKRINSIPSIFGGTDHYDEDGNYLGCSMPGIVGGTVHTNADGTPAGYSTDGIFGGTIHHHADGLPAGYSTDSKSLKENHLPIIRFRRIDIHLNIFVQSLI